jgi:hypothetical protein
MIILRCILFLFFSLFFFLKIAWLRAELNYMAAFLPVSSQWLHLKVPLTEHLNTISHLLLVRSLIVFCESRVRVRVPK